MEIQDDGVGMDENRLREMEKSLLLRGGLRHLQRAGAHPHHLRGRLRRVSAAQRAPRPHCEADHGSPGHLRRQASVFLEESRPKTLSRVDVASKFPPSRKNRYFFEEKANALRSRVLRASGTRPEPFSTAVSVGLGRSPQGPRPVAAAETKGFPLREVLPKKISLTLFRYLRQGG